MQRYPGEKAYLKVSEVASLFDVTVQAVHLWLRNGRVRHHSRTSARGYYRIPRQEVVRLLRDADQEAPGLWERSKKAKPRVVVIDGHVRIRKRAEAAARQRGFPFQVRTAPNVEDGLLAAARFEPHVIVLDSSFGEERMDADDALLFIRRAKLIRDVTVIGMSGSQETGAKMLAAGADGFIKKPFSLKELWDLISRIVLRRERF